MEGLNFGNNSDGIHLPPGYRFHPTDEELITHYLLKKVLDRRFSGPAIADVDLNKCEPWDLPERAKMGEKEWYFFSLRDRKYPTGLRTNRATDAGYWKATGKDREIFNPRSNSLVGMKKTLVFYKGRAPKGEKSNWVMHEYRLDGNISYHHLSSKSTTAKVDEWVICRIFQKSIGGGKKTATCHDDDGNAYRRSPSASPPPLSADSESSEVSLTARDRHVSCFSTAYTRPRNNNVQDLSDIDSLMRTSHILQNMGLDDYDHKPPFNNKLTAFPPQQNHHHPLFYSHLSAFHPASMPHHLPNMDISSPLLFQTLPGLTQNSLLRNLAGGVGEQYNELQSMKPKMETKAPNMNPRNEWVQRGNGMMNPAQQTHMNGVQQVPDPMSMNSTGSMTHNPVDLDWILNS